MSYASFPIVNETTEIVNQLYYTPWYNTWWEILLQIIIFPIGLVRLLYWEFKKAKKVEQVWIIIVLGIFLGLIIWLNSSFLIMH